MKLVNQNILTYLKKIFEKNMEEMLNNQNGYYITYLRLYMETTALFLNNT